MNAGSAQRYEQNTGWKTMLHYAVAWSFRVHADSFRDSSERSLDSPENSVAGLQPVFFRATGENALPTLNRKRQRNPNNRLSPAPSPPKSMP
jgi:hypothetical protein